MKALSVRQPWAQLLAEGEKTIEVRSYPWGYRGPLVICASAKPVFRLEGEDEPLPTGAAIGIVDMIDCHPLQIEDGNAAWWDDLTPEDCTGQWAWVMSNARLVHPVPVKGQVRPWTWNGPELIESND